MAIENFSKKEKLTSTKMNTLVDQLNNNTESIKSIAATGGASTASAVVFDDGENAEKVRAQIEQNVGSKAEQEEVSELAQKTGELDNNQEQLIVDVKAVPDYSALPLLCGQPPILYGAGTPQESVVPTNWNQFDPETGEGYNWNGEPSAIGQVYINTSATSNGRYTAIPSGTDGVELKWVNF